MNFEPTFFIVALLISWLTMLLILIFLLKALKTMTSEDNRKTNKEMV